MRKGLCFFMVLSLMMTAGPVWAKRYIKDDDKNSSKNIERRKGRAAIKSQDEWNWDNSSRAESIKEDLDRKRKISASEYKRRLDGREKRIKERKKIKENRIKRRKNDRNRAKRGADQDTKFKEGEATWKGGGVKHTPEGPMKVENEGEDKTQKGDDK